MAQSSNYLPTDVLATIKSDTLFVHHKNDATVKHLEINISKRRQIVHNGKIIKFKVVVHDRGLFWCDLDKRYTGKQLKF